MTNKITLDRELVKVATDCLSAFAPAGSIEAAVVDDLRAALAEQPQADAQPVACPPGYELVALPIDGDDSLRSEPCETVESALTMLDFALSFALCNRDHGGTRRDVKKAQRFLEQVKALFTHPAPAKVEPVPPTGGEPETIAYTTNGRTRVVLADQKQDAVWNAGRPLIYLEDHRAHVTRLQAEVEQWRASNMANALAAGKLVEDLRAQLADKQTLADNYCALLMDANGKLAERDALLWQWDAMWNGGGIYNGPLTKLREATKSALSASAEPAKKMCDCNQGRLPCTCKSGEQP